MEDDGELNKYLGIDLDRRSDGSTHLRLINMIPGIDKSSSKSTPGVKPPLSKNEGAQARKNNFNYISVIGSLNFLTKLSMS